MKEPPQLPIVGRRYFSQGKIADPHRGDVGFSFSQRAEISTLKRGRILNCSLGAALEVLRK